MSRALLVAGIATLCGCADAGPKGYDQPATIILYRDSSRIVAPDTVTRGASFDVTFDTYGGGCSSKGETTTEQIGAAVLLRPYHHMTGADACTRILYIFRHTVPARIDTKGSALIRLIGVEAEGRPAELSRPVFVR